MITSVVMPQMGLEVVEGTVAAIAVATGARVSAGDPLIEMETDKALAEVPAPRDGVVRAIAVDVGDTVLVGATLLLLADTADEELPADHAVAVAVAVAEPDSGPEPVASSPAVARTSDGRVRAAPVARRAADRLGIAIEAVEGTGPRGRITLRDVERAAAADHGNGNVAIPTAPADATRADPVPLRVAAALDGGERVQAMTPMRRAIARRMATSQLIPQFTLTREIDASWLLEQKSAIAADGHRAGVSDLLVQAMAETALLHPDLAASYTETDDGTPALLHRQRVDIGLAVATPRGLLVPVIRGAGTRTLAEVAAERARLVGDARSGRLRQDDMSDATMTLSNLSSFGVDQFTAMLNPGESAILAVGRSVDRVVPRGRGIAVVPALTLSLTVDHRVADGATGAAALVELAELLEGAMTWRT